MLITYVRGISRSASAWRWEGDGFEFDCSASMLKMLKIVTTTAMSDARP